MSRHLGLYVSYFLACLTLSAAVHAQGEEDPSESARSSVVNQDAGSEPESADAGDTKPKCIEQSCDDAGVCPTDNNADNCEADDQIIDPRVNPPSERDMTGCGCSWYQMSSSYSLTLLGLGLMLGIRRRKR